MATYTPSAAAKILQIAPSTIRNHTNNPAFRPYFSPSATPTPGQARMLTDHDLQVLRFILENTRAGATLDATAERLAQGELDATEWSPPGAEGPDQAGAAAILPAVFASLQQQVADKDALIQQLTRELLDLQKEIGPLLGRLQAKDSEIEYLRSVLEQRLNEEQRSLWRRLFPKR